MKTTVHDEARVQQGDQLASGEKAIGNHNAYGTHIASGKATVSQGTRVGVGDIFQGSIARRGEGREDNGLEELPAFVYVKTISFRVTIAIQRV